ncbi:MAG: pyridoxal-phosphate dependent enzyme [Gemmatimonadota bacterium]|nr:pyridoxal-phosphate dependent enzyme [Gemmatimonadota bacterium]
MTSLPDALARAASLPAISLGSYPTPIDEMARLRDSLGGGPRLLVKRDDAISFGFGGNKVRKLQLVAARAQADGADTLVTVGGVQSNHARATAAAAAKLGMRCVLVANGAPSDHPTGNALLAALLGAELQYVSSRAERAPAMRATVERLRAEGRRPAEIPLGASTPLGAMGFVRGVSEIVGQGVEPDVIVHACSSGGTQAGIVAGCALHGLRTRVIGISADDPADAIRASITSIIDGIADMLGAARSRFPAESALEVDATFVGTGYGDPTAESREAQSLAARSEALFVDHTYTAKALAALIAFVRRGDLKSAKTILFWHTGGQVGLFA